MKTHPSLTPKGVEILTQVAEWLEAGAPHVDKEGSPIAEFDMDVGVLPTDCGAVCCIAGAVCQFNQPFTGGPYTEGCEFEWKGDDGVMDRASRLLFSTPLDLEVTWVLARNLFRPNEDNEGITAAVAAQTLRRYLATGDVKWEIPEPPDDDEDED